jgi:group I intron endonuclease
MTAYGIIYLIRNLDNGKVYVGQTTQPMAARWKQHCSDAAFRRSYPLHLAIRKYGRDRFELVILAECSGQDELNRRESELVVENRAGERGMGYNVRSGGDGGGPHSAETRMKQSLAKIGIVPHNKGKKMPEVQRLQMIERLRSHPRKRRPLSEETKAKIGAANAIRGLGRIQSEATRQRHREATIKRFASPEARRNHSEALQGHVCSEETKQKLRTRLLGRTIPEEWREKLRQANLGKKQSAETIAKISAALRAAHEKRREAHA